MRILSPGHWKAADLALIMKVDTLSFDSLYTVASVALKSLLIHHSILACTFWNSRLGQRAMWDGGFFFKMQIKDRCRPLHHGLYWHLPLACFLKPCTVQSQRQALCWDGRGPGWVPASFLLQLWWLCNEFGLDSGGQTEGRVWFSKACGLSPGLWEVRIHHDFSLLNAQPESQVGAWCGVARKAFDLNSADKGSRPGSATIV